jgi:hypothetical protein
VYPWLYGGIETSSEQMRAQSTRKGNNNNNNYKLICPHKNTDDDDDVLLDRVPPSGHHSEVSIKAQVVRTPIILTIKTTAQLILNAVMSELELAQVATEKTQQHHHPRRRHHHQQQQLLQLPITRPFKYSWKWPHCMPFVWPFQVSSVSSFVPTKRVGKMMAFCIG